MALVVNPQFAGLLFSGLSPGVDGVNSFSYGSERPFLFVLGR